MLAALRGYGDSDKPVPTDGDAEYSKRAAESDFWIRSRMNSRHRGGTPFDAAAVDEYVRCFADPAAIAASCADYRAAAGIDLVHDKADADRRVTCPLLVLWGEHSFVGRSYAVLDVWREHATDVNGWALLADTTCRRSSPRWRPTRSGSSSGRRDPPARG